jgi:hypothetical protein
VTVTTLSDALQFFRVVRPVPRLMRLSFAVVTIASMLRLIAGSDRVALTLLPILLLQMFAVSTGFMAYARRGHFDLLFTRGAGRVQVAALYWLLSAMPGLRCWLTLAIVEFLWQRTTSLVSGGTVAVVLCVSMLPWAISVPLTRFSGATGWLLVLVMAVTLTPAGAGPYHVWQSRPGEPWWWSAVAFLLFPGRVAGESLDAHGSAVITVLMLVVASMAAAFAWVWRADLPLETGQ